MTGIPIYTDINDLHRLTGSTLRASNPLIHCFDMAETNDLSARSLSPHRADFYTVALNLDTQGLRYTLNQNDFREPKFVVVCVAPEQVVQWSKEGDWFGKSAKRIISQRRLTEACYLLQYTNSTVAEIGDYLAFSEPTHFVKFLKNEMGFTAAAYRVNQLSTSPMADRLQKSPL